MIHKRESQEALKRTFRHRRTDLPVNKPVFVEEIYDGNSDRQVLWRAFLKKQALKHVPEKLTDVAQEIERFLVDPLAAIMQGQKFNKKWEAPGPWKRRKE